MDTHHFSAKLEPFLLMAKGLKGAAAAKLIKDATAAPGVYVFGELLEIDGIRELKNNPQHASSYELLRIFAYKTYEDYLQTPNLPALTPVQETKLKQLSIVSLASRGRLIPYSLLLSSLRVPTVRELEDLVIEAVYGGILQCKLDQQSESLEIEYAMGRDVDIESGGLEEILAGLRGWADQTAQVLHTLDTKLAEIASAATARRIQKDEDAKLVQSRLKEVSAANERDRGASGSAYMRERDSRRRDTYEDDHSPYEKSSFSGGSGRILGERQAGGGGGFTRGMRRILGGGKDERDPDPRDRENMRGDSMDVDEPASPLVGGNGRGKNRKASLESVGSQQGAGAAGGSSRGPVRKRNKF